MDTQDIYNLQEAYMSIYQDVDYLTEDAHLSSDIYNEEVNYYNIILSYLIDEGYAESPESAVGIMVNMSEDWKDCIIDEELTGPRREYALDRSEKLRSLAGPGFRKVRGPQRDISHSLLSKAGKLEKLATRTQGGGWENLPRKRGGSGLRGEPKEMDFAVPHDRSQKSTKELIKSKLRKRALRDIKRR
jgi:hypothetical protein